MGSWLVPNILKLLSTLALKATTGVKYDGFQSVAWLFEVLLPGSARYAASALLELLPKFSVLTVRGL